MRFYNTTNPDKFFSITAPNWGDFLIGQSTSGLGNVFFSYLSAQDTLKLGGLTTSKTQVFGSLSVSPSDAFVPLFPLHIDGNAKVNGNITVGANNSEFSGLTDLAASIAPTSTSSTLGATANSLTNAYNFIVNNRVPASVNFGTTSPGTVTFGNVSVGSVINGSSLTFGSTLSPNVSAISATASGAGKVLGLPQVAIFSLTGETSAVSVSSTPVTHFRIPFPWKILGCRANLYTPSSGGQVVIDIRSVSSGINIPTSVAGGTSIFSTTLRVDATRSSSVGSATDDVITAAANSTGLADDTGLSVFITSAGTGAAGLKLVIYYSVF
jgi:hypothetical protein